MRGSRLVLVMALGVLSCKHAASSSQLHDDGDPVAATTGEDKATSPLASYAETMTTLLYDPAEVGTCPTSLASDVLQQACGDMGCTAQDLATGCSDSQNATALRLADDQDQSQLEAAIFAAVYGQMLTDLQNGLSSGAALGTGGDGYGSTGTSTASGLTSGTSTATGLGSGVGTGAVAGSDGYNATSGLALDDSVQLFDGNTLMARAVGAALDLLYNPNSARAQQWTIPYSRFSQLFGQMVQASVYGAGFGLAGSISATVAGKSLALEEVLLPATAGQNDMAIGYYCNTAMSVNTPDLSAGVQLYGIKALGCQSHADYAGTSIGLAFNLGVPLALGSVGGALGASIAVDLPKLVSGIQANAAVLANPATAITEAPALAAFLTQYVTQKATDAGAMIASASVGGLVSDVVLQNGARSRQSGATGNAALNTAMMQVYNALEALTATLNTLNKTAIVPAALGDLITAMSAYETANNVTLTRAKTIAQVLKDTFGCNAITAGIAGSVGLGVKEDTPSPVSFGAAAFMGNAHLLATLKASDLQGFAAAVNQANADYRRTTNAAAAALQQLNAATNAQDVLAVLVRNVQSCIDNLTVNTYFGPIRPPAPAVALCLGLNGTGLEMAQAALSGNLFTRLQSLQSAAANAGETFRGASAVADIALGQVRQSAQTLAAQIAAQLRPMLTQMAGCALDTATVPFATTILDNVGGSGNGGG